MPFDLAFRRNFSIDEFAGFLAEHLNKTQKEREGKEKVNTYFMTMSLVLEWTIHTAGQKWKGRDADEVVGLAIFDVTKL